MAIGCVMTVCMFSGDWFYRRCRNCKPKVIIIYLLVSVIQPSIIIVLTVIEFITSNVPIKKMNLSRYGCNSA